MACSILSFHSATNSYDFRILGLFYTSKILSICNFEDPPNIKNGEYPVDLFILLLKANTNFGRWSFHLDFLEK